MISSFFPAFCNFTRNVFFGLKNSCVKVLLILQVAAIIPMPRLSADTTTITIEVSKPPDEMWNNFDSSYETLLNLVSRLEKTADAENVDEEVLEELRRIVIRLAQFGSADATAEEAAVLVNDIIGLFIDEEDEINDLPSDFYNTLSKNLNNPQFSFDEEMRYLPCDFWKKAKKKTKRCAHNVAKFVRHHKKEILIGAAAVIVVGVAVYVIAGACAAETAAAASAAAAGASSDNKNDDAAAASDQVQSPEAQIIEQIAHLKEALVAEKSSSKQGSVFQDPVGNEELSYYAKKVASKLAHDLWNEFGKTGALALEVKEEIKKTGCLLIPEEIRERMIQEGERLSTLDQTKENWQKHIAEGHEKIDQWFDQPIPYDAELERSLEERFATGTPPFPIGSNQALLQDVKKISQIGNLIRSGEPGAMIAEEIAIVNRSQTALEEASILERQVGSSVEKAAVHESAGIRIRMDGVWEIEGKNIKKFDMNTIDNNKLNHLFGDPDHQLHRFTCSKNVVVDQVTRSIIEADRAGKIPLNKDFSIHLQVDGHVIEVRGIVLDGELRYGTFFIPKGK